MWYEGAMTLLDFREKNGWNRSQLGGLIGVTGMAVKRYEDGDRIPHPDVMGRIITLSKRKVMPNDFYPVAAA